MATCMLLWQSRFGFSFGFHDRWRRPLTPILDGMVVKLDHSLDFGCRILTSIAKYVYYNYFSDVNLIDNIQLTLWKLSDFS